jgi:DNA-binding CsgD family transcriptional regulator
MALGEDRLPGAILPLVIGSDWRRPSPYQIRTMSRLFGVVRGIAGLAVLGLAGLLVQSSWKPGVAFLIFFVTAYNSLALLAFYRGSDRTVLTVSRVIAVLDVVSFFVMLWSFGPTPPGALVACYIALVNVHIATEGITGGAVSLGLFVAGYGALGGMGTAVEKRAFPATDFLLWSVVITVMAVSLLAIQQVLTQRQPPPADATAGRVIPAPAFRLSPREREVLQLVSEGYSNTMIANRLHLSDNTVKGYVEALLTRLNARNRAEAVAAASRLNLL